jgi:Zn-dependent metalloprotease
MAQKLATVVMLVVAAAGQTPAQEPLRQAVPETASVDKEESRPTALRKPGRGSSADKLQVRWRANGTVGIARGFAGRSYPGTTAEAARAFIADNDRYFGGVQLGAVSERRLGARTYVRLQQRIGGVPVRNAHVVLSLDGGNAVRAVNAHVEPSAAVSGEWRISQEDATAKAVAAHGATPSEAARAERQYTLTDRGAVPVWAVTFRSASPAGDWEYLIGADDGRVLGRDNLRQGASGLGYAYPRNPVKGARERVRLENLSSNGMLSSEQSNVFSNFAALKGQVEPGKFVRGAIAKDGNFLYDANDPRAAEVQMYWAMEAAYARFSRLGFEGFRQPLTGIVYYQDWDPDKKRFVGSDNAFFLPNAFGEGRGGMFLFLTARQGDTSLDTDIVFHEYAHAVVSEYVGPRQTRGFRALNEGTADYFSSTFLDDPVMAEYAAKIFGMRRSYVRRTDNDHVWPYSTVGEEHADGNIWSGALWDVRRVLGAEVADEIALNTIAFLSPDSEFYDAAATAVLAAEELFDTRTADTVAEIMEARGILTDSAETASGAKWLQNKSTASGSVSAARSGYPLLAAQQYRIDVPHRATKLFVRMRANADARFYLRYRVPVTIENGKLQAEQMSEIGTAPSGYLSLDNTPELQAGTYYIAVVNASTSRLSYEFDVEVENYDPAAFPALVRLEHGVAARGSLPSGPFLGSRQFLIEVPEGTSALSVTLEGDTDVDLYVRQNNFVLINDTGYPEADLVSNSESSREDMRITGQSGRPIPPGVYVFGVYNYSSETTRFKITARLER